MLPVIFLPSRLGQKKLLSVRWQWQRRRLVRQQIMYAFLDAGKCFSIPSINFLLLIKLYILFSSHKIMNFLPEFSHNYCLFFLSCWYWTKNHWTTKKMFTITMFVYMEFSYMPEDKLRKIIKLKFGLSVNVVRLKMLDTKLIVVADEIGSEKKKLI